MQLCSKRCRAAAAAAAAAPGIAAFKLQPLSKPAHQVPSIYSSTIPLPFSLDAALFPSVSSGQSAHITQACPSPPQEVHQEKARLAVFVSGGGSNFRAIHAACLDGRINAEVVAVISDKPTCGGVQYAQANNMATLTYPRPKKGDFPGLSKKELVDALKVQHKVCSCQAI